MTELGARVGRRGRLFRRYSAWQTHWWGVRRSRPIAGLVITVFNGREWEKKYPKDRGEYAEQGQEPRSDRPLHGKEIGLVHKDALRGLGRHGLQLSHEEFLRLRIGPVVMKDEVEYFKEVGLQQKIVVNYAIAGHALDGSRFLLRHEIFRADGKLSARVTSAGGWLDLAQRKLIVPPPLLLAAMNALEKTSDFVVLPSSIKSRA